MAARLPTGPTQRYKTGTVEFVYKASGNCVITRASETFHYTKLKGEARLQPGDIVQFLVLPEWVTTNDRGKLQRVTSLSKLSADEKAPKASSNAVAPSSPRPSVNDPHLVRYTAELKRREDVLAEREAVLARERAILDGEKTILDTLKQEMHEREAALADQKHKLEETIDLIAKREERNRRFELRINPHEISQLPEPVVTDDFNWLSSLLIKDLGSEDSDLRFSRSVIAMVIAAVSGQLVLFAGPPGAGKSTLARNVSSNLSISLEEFSVRPGWIDSTDLFGFTNVSGTTFLATQFLTSMIAASHKPEALHALLLEEINLARIENYAGDLLVSLDRPTTSPIRLYSAEQSSVANSSTFPPAIFLPRNVLLLGTLNHDETTMRLSPKVKDRSVFVRVSSFNHQVETVTSDLLPVVNLHAGLRDLIGRDAGLRDGIEGDSETANEVVKAWADLCELRATSRGAVRKAIVLSARTLRGLKALCSAAKWLKLDVSTAVDLFVSMKLLPWLEFYGGDQITLSDLISFKDDLRKKGYSFSASEVEFLCEQDDAAISYLQ